MLVLALDTSTPVLTVAVADLASGEASDPASGAVVERSLVAANRHGELLAPLIDEVMAAASATPSSLAAVVVGLGPGPFTGLRVGVVTAAALSDALGVPAYGVCSLDLVAADVGAVGAGFAVVTDARRRQVYWATYDENRRRLDGPELSPPAALAATLRPRLRIVAGPAAPIYAEAFADFQVLDAQPRARAAVTLAADRIRSGAPADVLEPMYLRRPDARPPGAPKKVTPA